MSKQNEIQNNKQTTKLINKNKTKKQNKNPLLRLHGINISFWLGDRYLFLPEGAVAYGGGS